MKKYARRILLSLSILVLIATGFLPSVSALDPGQKQVLSEGIPYFNVCSSSSDSSSSSASGGTASGTPSGGISFDDKQSGDTGGVTTIDDDGVDPSPTGSSDHQGQTSYADGQLGALHTSYIALNPVWSQKNGIVLGDVAALTYQGKTIYAVYGDNHSGDNPHAEISVHAAMALTGITDPAQAENSLSGVHFTIYPNTHQQLNGSVDQSKIDQIGAQVSGAGSTSPSSGGSTSSSSSGCCNSTATTTSFGSGSLPSSVPAPYNGIITAAANKFNIAPALLAGIFYGGEHGNSWPDPPPPYGHGSAWASSGVASSGSSDWPTQPPGPGAAGPFQFEYPTWQKYQQDGNGDGKKDVEDLADAAFGAADYLAAAGAKGSTDKSNLTRAILAYNPAQFYVNDVLAAYQKFGGTYSGGVSSSNATASSPAPSTGCSTSGATGAFTNPFPDGWSPNRLDMGYDGTFKNQIVAPFSGTITYATTSFSDWGGYVELKADQKPADLPTSTLYFAEGVAPVSSTEQGSHVNAGDPIAKAYTTGAQAGIPGNIEFGVAAEGVLGSPTDPYAEAALGAGKCPAATAQSRSMVLNFAQWVEQNLHVAPPSSTSDAGCA